MFMDIDKFAPGDLCALSDNGERLTYGELVGAAHRIRDAAGRGLVFAFSENNIGSLCGYTSFLSNGIVPLMLSGDVDRDMLKNLTEAYNPAYYWIPNRAVSDFGFPVRLSMHGYSLLETGLEPFALHDDLALLITTSGSTGSPKLVRQSYRNLKANAESIAEYLEIEPADRQITTLPMNYVYGLSVINTHLMRGAVMLLTNNGIMQKEFWDFFKESKGTGFAGVPYTYEMLKRLRFMRMDLPDLRVFTQAGGKLQPELHREFAEYAARTGKRFFVMYGASEATSRMAYLPAEKALEKSGSMGIAIPGGKLSLLDDEGAEIESASIVGELCYRGDNVTLGYAENGGDLSLGDERDGVYLTGDMAKKDNDGYFYVVGRKKRFLKIFGNRISLDESERILKQAFPDYELACAGADDLMTIFVEGTASEKDITALIAGKTGIHPSAFRVREIEKIPKNESGKTLYMELNKLK